MCFFREFQGVLEVHTSLAECLSFLHEEYRIKHHTVADEVGFFVLEDAGGDGAEHIFLAVELQSVTGIGPSLETCHNVVARSEHIHNFTFTLVAPLEAEQNVNFHIFSVCFLV